MKVLITEDSLDSLLSVKISADGGNSYTDYSVSSLKSGLTFDCSPKDLKVICDGNTLKYIQVLANGEKAVSSDIDLSNYLKYKDITVDVYKNPYYGSEDLSDEEINKLSDLENRLYKSKNYEYYCEDTDGYFMPTKWSDDVHLYDKDTDGTAIDPHNFYYDYQGNNIYFIDNSITYLKYEFWYNLVVTDDYGYMYDNQWFYTNARIRFIKHF